MNTTASGPAHLIAGGPSEAVDLSAKDVETTLSETARLLDERV